MAGNLISEIMFGVINDTHQTANLGPIIVVRQEALVNKRCRWIKSTTRGYVLTSGIENSLGNHSPNDGDVGKGMLKQEASTNVVDSTLYDAAQKWPLVRQNYLCSSGNINKVSVTGPSGLGKGRRDKRVRVRVQVQVYVRRRAAFARLCDGNIDGVHFVRGTRRGRGRRMVIRRNLPDRAL